MNDFNSITLSGRLTRDAEIKFTNTGKSVLNFSIANNQGTKENPKVNFINCVLWGNLAESIVAYMLKGKQVFIIGRLDIRTWDDNEGKKRYATEIIVNDINIVNSDKKTEQQNFDQQLPIPDGDIPF